MKKWLSEFKRLILAAEEEEESPSAIHLAAGEPASVQCGRTGTFVGIGGVKVTLGKSDLAKIVSRFDPAEEHLAKIGHKKIDTDTPHYGNITAVAYDEAKDRLSATVVPTQALIEKNQKEGFRRVSMELYRDEEGYDFADLAFLGAAKPAIDGLDPVALAAAESTEDRKVFVFSETAVPDETAAELYEFSISAKQRDAIDAADFAGPARSFPIDTQAHLDAAATLIGKAADPAAVKAKAIAIAKRKGFTLPKSWQAASGEKVLDKGSTLHLENGEKQMADDKATARLARLEKTTKEGAADRVAVFLAANVKRIPHPLRKAGLEQFLAGVLTADLIADEPVRIKFATPDAKGKYGDVEETASEGFLRMLAALPEQTTAAQERDTATKELAHDPPDDDGTGEGKLPENVREFERKGIKFARSTQHGKILLALSEMRKTNPKATYSEAFDKVATER